jgi:hypothetical protein
MATTRHRIATIDLDGHRIDLGHVVTDGQAEDLLRILDPKLSPRVDDCDCDDPPHLSDDCRAGGCGMCIGFIEGNITACGCDCHPRGEQYQLEPDDVPPNAAYLERWLAHWQQRAVKTEARIAGVHAQAVDARRRELAEAVKRGTDVDVATMDKHLRKLVDACNRRVEAAAARRRARS